MITLAFDSATYRCTVAATDGVRVAERHLDGSRGHATAILELLDAVLAEVGVTVADVDLLVTGDGPGSFTGLRVATSVAKAIVWGRDLRWCVAPSLLIQAAAHAADGAVVLAVSDALRGDVYAGCWRFEATSVRVVDGMPRAMHPEALRALGAVDVVVGELPPAVAAAVEQVTGRSIISDASVRPDARQLLRLAQLSGGTELVTDAAAWEPEYGRPAEAQAVWERKHGRQLPDTPGISR